MPLQQNRGGIPKHVNESTGIAETRRWGWNDQGASGGPANYLWFKNTGGGALTLAFDEESADNSDGITLAAGDVWEGPVEIGSFFTRAAADQTFEAIAYVRRG